MITNLYKKNAERIVAHEGKGEILFRRVLDREFSSGIEFLDYTVMPPKTTIGYHQHVGSEEIYVILSGSGKMMLNGTEKRVSVNDVILACNGDWHGLENDTDENLIILVFEGKVDE